MNIATVTPGLYMEERTAPFTSWEVPSGFVTFDIVQRFDNKVYHFGASHVFDDGVTRIVVTPGNRDIYTAPGYYMSVENLAGKPGQQFSNVQAALSAGRAEVLKATR